LAKVLYDEGNFARSYGIINQLEAHLLNDELWLKTTWARLYCEIMLKKGESKRTAERVREKLNTLDEEAGEEKIKHVLASLIVETLIHSKAIRSEIRTA
jgi:hypothetical protein